MTRKEFNKFKNSVLTYICECRQLSWIIFIEFMSCEGSGEVYLYIITYARSIHISDDMLPAHAFIYDFELIQVRRRVEGEYSDEEDTLSSEGADRDEEDEEQIQRDAVAVGGLTAARSGLVVPNSEMAVAFVPAVVPTKIVRKSSDYSEVSAAKLMKMDPSLQEPQLTTTDEGSHTGRAVIKITDGQVVVYVSFSCYSFPQSQVVTWFLPYCMQHIHYSYIHKFRKKTIILKQLLHKKLKAFVYLMRRL